MGRSNGSGRKTYSLSLDQELVEKFDRRIRRLNVPDRSTAVEILMQFVLDETVPGYTIEEYVDRVILAK